MVRVIALADDDKAWLDREARSARVPMTELIRRAVASFRALQRPTGRSVHEALDRTAGIWRRGDGLAWQRRLREEWE